MKSNRLVIDTNLLISFLITKRLQEIDNFILSEEIKLLFSEELLLEVLEVIKRPKFNKYFSDKDILTLLELFDYYGELVTVKSDINLCRDKKDNFLLNLAIDGKAAYLLTGDNDLLVLGKVNKTRIVSWTDFLKLFEKK